MSRIGTGLWVGLIAWTLLLFCPALAGDRLILTSGEWPPFFSEQLPCGGVGNRIVAESFKRAGVDVEFVYQPWMRAMRTARYGSAHGSSGWLRTPERERAFLFSDPIFTSRRVFFHRRDNDFRWRTLDDIRDLRVAVTLGSADEFAFEPVLAKGSGKLDLANSYTAGMRKLAAGRVDVYACNLSVGLHVLAHHMPRAEAVRITHHPRPIFEEANHLILSRRLPNAEALMARFNEGLRQLRESGRHAEIMRPVLTAEPARR